MRSMTTCYAPTPIVFPITIGQRITPLKKRIREEYLGITGIAMLAKA